MRLVGASVIPRELAAIDNVGIERIRDDIFIPLPGVSDPLIAGKKYSRDDLAKALHEEAKQQIELVTDTSS